MKTPKRMGRLLILASCILAAGYLESLDYARHAQAFDLPECVTDSECAELCPKGTRDLPVDHPDYCDGGPQ